MRYIFNLFFAIVIDFITNFKFGIRTLSISKIPEAYSTGEKGIILHVGGWMERWSYMYTVLNFCNSLGYKIHTLDKLLRVNKSIADCARILEEKLVNENLSDVILVCHSKGGLIAKYFLDNSKESHRVTKVISIATPFKGTYLAYIFFAFAYEFIPNSKLLNKLNSNTMNNHKFYNFFARIDTEVIPNKNLYLEGAQNIKIDVVGHTRILESQKLFKEIEKVLTN